MSIRAEVGVSNRAFVGEEGGHSLSKDSGIADLSDVIPELPPKTSPRPAPKVFVKNPSAHKYENQFPLPQGPGSANSSSKRRPDNLAIPNHISSMKTNDRPVSSVHDYEELPLEKRNKSKPRLKKVTRNDERYTPSPPPIPSLTSIPSQNFDIYSQAGSDVTMISDGPRKRQNPLYDSAKVISQPDHKDNKNGSDCFRKHKIVWIFLIVFGLAILLLLVLLVLVIMGALGEKPTTISPQPQVDNGAKNRTTQLEADLIAALKRVRDLESKVIELDTVLSFLGNTSHNSSLLTRFDEVVKNTSLNTAAVRKLDTRVTDNTNKLTLVDATVVEYRKEALKNNQDLSDTINLIKKDDIGKLKTDVGKLNTRITALNTTIHSQIIADMQNLQNDVSRLNDTALTDCKLNTTIFESFSSVHTELDTPYVAESADYAIVGVQCSSFGFKAHTRMSEDFTVDGNPYIQYKCKCFNKWANAKLLRCGVHVLLCSTAKK